MTLTFGSLFAGIGGMDLGFERAGLQCKWQVEIDPYCQKVLAKHWPNVTRWDDVKTFPPESGDWNVDIICGGFPCQDISFAGRGAGLDGERSGLFFEVIRVAEQLQPRMLVLENVAALLNRGLDRVLGALAEIGFDAEWHCIPAAAVGAPHIRDRVFLLAYPEHRGLQERRRTSDAGCNVREPRTVPSDVTQGSKQQAAEILADTNNSESKRQRQHGGKYYPSKKQHDLARAVAIFPTPTARDWKSGKGKTQQERGRSAGPSLSEVSGGTLNPTWVEWLMGFPIGYTDLEDSETP